MVQPQVVQNLLAHGSSVDITDLDFNADTITGLVQLAVEKSCVLTIGKGYGTQFYEHWASIGGKNVAFRL